MRPLLASIFALSVRSRCRLYRQGWLHSIALPAKVISIGNISVGGTGKSAFTMLFARWAVSRGVKPAILSRGYARTSKQAYVVSAKQAVPSVMEIGDEPFMMKTRVPEATLVVHARRGRVAQENWSQINSEIVFLDDAFQHWPIQRDVDVVLFDMHDELSEPLVPCGRFREPIESIARADIVICTRAGSFSANEWEKRKLELQRIHQQHHGGQAAEGQIEAAQPRWPWKKNSMASTTSVPVFFADYKANAVFVRSMGRQPLRELQDKRIIALCGIAKPESFLKTLESVGIEPTDRMFFPDHKNLGPGDIKRIYGLYANQQDTLLLTTEKDYHRWQEHLKGMPLAYLQVDPSIYLLENGKKVSGEEKLASLLFAKQHK